MPQEKRQIVNDLAAPSAAQVGPQIRVGRDFFNARGPRRQIGAADFASLSRSLAGALTQGRSIEGKEARETVAADSLIAMELAREENISLKQANAKAVARGDYEAQDHPIHWITMRETYARDVSRRAVKEAEISLQKNLSGLFDSESGVPNKIQDPGTVVDAAFANAFKAMQESDPEMADDFYASRMLKAENEKGRQRLMEEYTEQLATMRLDDNRKRVVSEISDNMLAFNIMNPDEMTPEDAAEFQDQFVYLAGFKGGSKMFQDGLNSALEQIAREDFGTQSTRGSDLMEMVDRISFKNGFKPSTTPGFQAAWARVSADEQKNLQRAEQVDRANADAAVREYVDQPDGLIARLIGGEKPTGILAEARLQFKADTDSGDKYAYEKFQKTLNVVAATEQFSNLEEREAAERATLAVVNGDLEALESLYSQLSPAMRAKFEAEATGWADKGYSILNDDLQYKQSNRDQVSLRTSTPFLSSGMQKEAFAEWDAAMTEADQASYNIMVGDGSPSAAEYTAALPQAIAARQAIFDKANSRIAAKVATSNAKVEGLRLAIRNGEVTPSMLDGRDLEQELGTETIRSLRGLLTDAENSQARSIAVAKDQSVSSEYATIFGDPDHAANTTMFTTPLGQGSPQPTGRLDAAITEADKEIDAIVNERIRSKEGREALNREVGGGREALVKQWHAEAARPFIDAAKAQSDSQAGPIGEQDEDTSDEVRQLNVIEKHDGNTRSYVGIQKLGRREVTPPVQQFDKIATLIGNNTYVDDFPDDWTFEGALRDTPFEFNKQLLRQPLHLQDPDQRASMEAAVIAFARRSGREKEFVKVAKELGRDRAIIRFRDDLLDTQDDVREQLAHDYGDPTTGVIIEKMVYVDSNTGVATPWFFESERGRELEQAANDDGFPSIIPMVLGTAHGKATGNARHQETAARHIKESVKNFDRLLDLEDDLSDFTRGEMWLYAHQDQVLDWRVQADGLFRKATKTSPEVLMTNPEFRSPSRHRFAETEDGLKEMTRKDNLPQFKKFLETLPGYGSDDASIKRFKNEQRKLFTRPF